MADVRLESLTYKVTWGTNMAEEGICLMTIFDGRADRQSIDQLNRLLDQGWRIAGINPTPPRLPGVGKFKAFVVELMKPSESAT
jgi:hypothetical protein